ncbi:MAG: ABC transporter permease [Anaerolineae bacterium]|nr:ABC transporter permease [Anaerolineae bacterium]
MLENFAFYIRHSINDLRVNGQRTFFALLCIAAGVAAIVSLQTLAVMIQSTLVGGLQESNRGDISIQSASTFVARGGADTVEQATEQGYLNRQDSSIFGQETDTYQISEAGIQAIEAWLEQNAPGAQVTYRQPLADSIEVFMGGGNGTTLVLPSTGTEAVQVIPILVDPQLYPFYSTITAQDGTPLSELITEPTDIVLSDFVNQALEANVGDTVRIAGSDADFTVRGIVDTGQEVRNPASDMFVSLFGFYYLDKSATALFADVVPQADMIFVRLADPAQVTTVNEGLNAAFPWINTTNTEDLRESYTALSDNINQLVTVMGLLSLLIGSIGIINTMQVIVRRRTVEVAVLKTLGLQAGQITILFLVEAVLMGILGSLLGIVLGWGAVFVIRGAAERLLATNLEFMIAAQPAITGFLVGVVVTTVFGFLPTLTAGQVRPGVVLRPTDTVIPRAGRIRTLLALVVIILVLSLIAQTILGSFTTALQIVVGAFVAAGVLYLLLTFLIWLVGHFVPSFGVIDLKLSLRQMLAGRGRAAMTLLALVVGVFSLSTITLLADSVNNLLQFSLEEASGGNVTISVGLPIQLPGIERVLNETEGVASYQVQQSYSMNLLSIQQGDITLTPDDIRERLKSLEVAVIVGPSGEGGEDVDLFSIFQQVVGRVDARELDSLPERTFDSGRQLTPDDAGQPVMVLGDNTYIERVGIAVGDKLTFEIESGGGLLGGSRQTHEVTFEVVGISAAGGFQMGFESQSYVPIDAFPSDISPTGVSILANVDKDQVPALRRALSGTLGVFVIENAMITRLITTLLGTFTAFPTMVATLGLVVGGIVIANSVALTTMERRREIAVMKSVGLQRERVLFMILLENGILGLIGGLIGVGIGLVALVALIGVTGAPGSAIPIGAALILMLLCVIVALIAAISTAWGASGEKPLNVLRYE